MPERREFLLGGCAALAALLFRGPSLSAQLSSSRIADSRIDVLLSEPLGTISPDIYGHFTENLGGVIYDGVWVGENSKVPPPKNQSTGHSLARRLLR
jgi:alpha-N-arabinofuranosidase